MLQEEMRRVKEFFSWEEWQWMARAMAIMPETESVLAEGQRAYALRQGLIRAQLRAHCETVWKDVPGEMAKGPGLPEGPDSQIYRIECH